MAVAAGLLTSDQVVELLGQQRADHVFLGQVAVEKGFAEHSQIDAALQAFHQQLEDSSLGETALSGQGALACLLEHVFELTSRVLRRMASLQSKLGKLSVGPIPDTLPEIRAAIQIHGEIEARFLMAMPEDLAKRIAAELFGEPVDDREELEDVVGECTNVIVGNFVRQHERSDFKLDFSTPQCGDQAVVSNLQTAFWMEMATPESGMLIAVLC